MANTSPPRVFISVAEQSADEHAAAFIRAFKEREPNATFAGLAGPAMRAAGCETFYDMTTRSAMALAAIRRVPEALLMLRRLKRYLAEGGFTAAVMVDSPTLNLPIAKLCRRLDIPVLYYIAPQTWAWAAWRNRRIRRRVNRLACIWPFEETYFRRFGIPATYVGHPTFDHLLDLRVDEAKITRLRGGATTVVTLLPGSRDHVVREVLPGQLDTAAAVKKRYPAARFLIVPANAGMRRLITETLQTHKKLKDVEILTASAGDSGAVGSEPALLRAAAIRAADLVLAASGTVTLEVAYHATPMIIMYNASRWLYQLIGRHLISTPFLSIPNIIAGREIVPEFMPYYRSADPIIAKALEWLATPASLARVRNDLLNTIKPLVKPGAARNAAEQLANMLAQTASNAPAS